MSLYGPTQNTPVFSLLWSFYSGSVTQLCAHTKSHDRFSEFFSPTFWIPSQISTDLPITGILHHVMRRKSERCPPSPVIGHLIPTIWHQSLGQGVGGGYRERKLNFKTRAGRKQKTLRLTAYLKRWPLPKFLSRSKSSRASSWMRILCLLAASIHPLEIKKIYMLPLAEKSLLISALERKNAALHQIRIFFFKEPDKAKNTQAFPLPNSCLSCWVLATVLTRKIKAANRF